MIKLLTLGIALFAVLSVATCGGGASSPTDPPNNTLPQQNQNDPATTPNGGDNQGGGDPGTSGDNGNANGGSSDVVSAYPPTDFSDGFHVYTYHYGYVDVIATYEGYWKSGLPNGEGVLTVVNSYSSFDQNNNPVDSITTYKGTLVDGLFHGLLRSENYIQGVKSTTVWIFETNLGVSTSETTDSECGTSWLTLTHSSDVLYGVPPWSFR